MRSVALAPLHHEEVGSGPALLLIHGTGGGGSRFAQAAEHLAKHHRVITYDRRGFAGSRGASHPRRGYHAAHADDAAQLLDELGIERAAVCGWSAGGLVALELALRHPERVSSLVLYEPPFHASRQFQPIIMAGFAWMMLLRLVGQRRAAARSFFRIAMGPDAARMPPGAVDKLLEDADAVLKEIDGGTGEAITEARLAQLACPVTLMVGGATSPFLIAASDRLNRMLPRAGVMRVPHAGHAMPMLQPLAFADAISRAIADMGAMVKAPRRE